MALRRGKILMKMRTDEEGRVLGLVDKMGRQEEAMQVMAARRQQLAEVRHEEPNPHEPRGPNPVTPTP